jgi:hypothetical protein
VKIKVIAFACLSCIVADPANCTDNSVANPILSEQDMRLSIKEMKGPQKLAFEKLFVLSTSPRAVSGPTYRISYRPGTLTYLSMLVPPSPNTMLAWETVVNKVPRKSDGAFLTKTLLMIDCKMKTTHPLNVFEFDTNLLISKTTLSFVQPIKVSQGGIDEIQVEAMCTNMSLDRVSSPLEDAKHFFGG